MVLTEKCEPSEIASRSSLRTEKIREIGGVFSSEPGLKSDSAGHSSKLRNPTVRTRMDSVHHVGLRIYRYWHTSIVVLAVVAKVPG